MSEFDKDSQALFDVARDAADPTAEDEARIHGALLAKLAATGVVLSTAKLSAASSMASAPAAKAAVSTTSFAFLAKFVPIAVAAVIGTSWMLTSRSAHHDSAANAALRGVEQRTTSAGTKRPSLVPPATFSAAPTAEPPKSSLQAPASSPRVSVNPKVVARIEHAEAELSNEVGLVTRMHDAWRNGKTAELQAFIREHQRRFPRGTLTEEREAIRAMLACRQNPRRAAEIANSFQQHHATSPHTARVKAACEDAAH